ncbi:MAG: site-specific DNA-methyltransferase, partial [Bacteroidetes bacterium]|nr:site-specific DNA-methyltransferase [Bacteroidota bacterium]
MAHERLRPEFLFDEEKIKQLKQLSPECFEDGKINFDTLRQNLGDWSQDEDDAELEHFGLFWPGKRDARKMAALPPDGTLEPVYGDGLKEDGTPDTNGINDSNNIFIEGENLEVLKILQKSYANKIKMIYIDPPYNTGNDFVYDDDFTEPLQEYLRRTGQIDEEGKALTTNKRSDGRFHSKWLSMMYPRLRLARNLLREDGVIFVSIDDNEVQNLRAMMNEIFGEETFIEQICWKNKYGAGAQTKGFISVHEYILCYSKNPIENIDSPLSEEAKNAYNKKDEKFSERGGYFTQPLMTNSLGDRHNLQYSIFHNNEEIIPNKQWVWSEERLLKAIEKDEVVFNKKKDGSYSVRSKQYILDEEGNERNGKPLSLLNGPFTQEGTSDIIELFGYNPFGFVKPVNLIAYLFSFSINYKDVEDDIYLDFFAGSGTSAQSVLKLNKKDKKNRRFICVQIPEMLNESDSNAKKAIKHLLAMNKPNSIAELTKERIRFAFKKYDTNLGFSCFKLTPSNYKKWQDFHGTDVDQLEQSLDLFNQSPLRI